LNCPALGAEVCGNGVSGEVIRFQKSSAGSSSGDRKASPPKVTDSGTCRILYCSSASGVRSEPESVTIATLIVPPWQQRDGRSSPA
jgi:hypothetical protein